MRNIAKEHRKVKRLSYTVQFSSVPSTGCVSTYTSRVTWDLHAQRWPSFSILKAGGHRKINSASSPPLTALEIQPFVKTSACWCQHSALCKLKLLVPSKRSKRSDISESCFCFVLFFTESLRVTPWVVLVVCVFQNASFEKNISVMRLITVYLKCLSQTLVLMLSWPWISVFSVFLPMSSTLHLVSHPLVFFFLTRLRIQRLI